MSYRKTYTNSERKPMAMAGFGRGGHFNHPRSSNSGQHFSGRGRGQGRGGPSQPAHHSSEAASKWAASVRESSCVSAKPIVTNDVVEKHIGELERIYMDESLTDKKKKSQAISKRLTEVLRGIPNPWEFVLRLVCGVADFEEAKTSSLAFTILLEFRNWTNSSENHMKDTSEVESCLSQELRVQVYNTFTGRHMPFFQVASKAFKLNHEGNEYFLPMIRQLLHQNKLTDVTNIVGALGLQDHFSQEEIVIPLLLSDKVNMLESYVTSSQTQQVALLSLLDHLCARNTDLLSFAQ
ncbi:exonuclease mut-7 homolog isoform X1 [Elysia marginata]|uniref:Exonuclease mut-7 homolog isoform X1 n=1 Tax=Elysia marginata TaxID=1093978 RepID=A0AAV4JR56_9GAST|nr:exonuclease mut-7 homolog isoform X1 [Elysia marginata]